MSEPSKVLYASHLPLPPSNTITTTCSEAYATTGYSPVLAFNVPDLQDTLMRCLGLGATMDGAIQHTPRGAVAALRGPDGQMISLIEGADDAGGSKRD